MGKIAFLFPGQGSQAPGMGRDAVANNKVAETLFQHADATLGFPISTLCFDGPEDQLKQTQNTQPALYIASAATLELFKEAGITPDAVAGHSLGEYSALYAAGVFDFVTGLKLVRTRGEAFATAGDKRPGAMAAILGLDSDQVVAICAASSTEEKVVVAANFNDPIQTVISGDPEAVEKASASATEAKAKRVIPLPVSGAFHSPLVGDASQIMKDALEPLKLNAPTCTFVNNADAAVLTDPDAIKDSLVRQVTNTVRWVACIEKLIEQGIDTFVEVGSGKVLAGLLRRIDKTKTVYTTESMASIEKTIAALKGE